MLSLLLFLFFLHEGIELGRGHRVLRRVVHVDLRHHVHLRGNVLLIVRKLHDIADLGVQR